MPRWPPSPAKCRPRGARSSKPMRRLTWKPITGANAAPCPPAGRWCRRNSSAARSRCTCARPAATTAWSRANGSQSRPWGPNSRRGACMRSNRFDGRQGKGPARPGGIIPLIHRHCRKPAMNARPQTSAPNLGMQPTTFENPMGIDGFEFVEFAAPAGQHELLRDQFTRMGFTAVLQHRTRPITVYRQGGVNFLVNEDPDSFAADFAKAHGPSACGFAIRFRKPGVQVLQTVLGNGGEKIDHKEASKAVNAA